MQTLNSNAYIAWVKVEKRLQGARFGGYFIRDVRSRFLRKEWSPSPIGQFNLGISPHFAFRYAVSTRALISY